MGDKGSRGTNTECQEREKSWRKRPSGARRLKEASLMTFTFSCHLSVKPEEEISPWLESKEELKGLFMKVKEVSENVGLQLNVQNTKITASGSITSWQIHGYCDRLYYLGLQNHSGQ